MRKRKEKAEMLKPRIAETDEKGEEVDEERSEEASGFFSCYLLASLCPRFKGHTYIGFTVNPKRRIRQHNGEIGCGAWRTKRKRPWEMVLCIYGFPTNVSALQFEWAWQHPIESLAVRKAAASFKSLSGIANKVKLAYTMLTLPAWCNLNITVNYFSTKYMKNAASCPSLPEHMRVLVSHFDDLPCYSDGDQGVFEKEDYLEHNSEQEDACSFRAHVSTQEEISNEMPKELGSDGISDDLHGCDKELEDDEPEPHTRTASSIVTGTSETEVTVDDRDMYKSEVSSMNLLQPGMKNFTPGMTTELNKPLSSDYGFPSEYEVIDLSTPSPDCRTSSYRYKRRVTSDRSEIIDLTKSPSFIQL